MKIKLLSSKVASGQALEAGKTYDVSDADAKLFLSKGWAIEAKEAPACPPKPKAVKKPKTDASE